MDELIERITREVGIGADTADTAVRIVLNFLHTDGPSETVERLAAEMGASEALSAPAGAGKGLLGALGGLLGGGGAMAAFSALSAAGLEMDQIQKLVQTIVGFARERVDDATVDEVIASIPGLERLL
ncbi:MAG TPA: DUF2267 domain-containing protein [Methylomirabilota bacterium]|nr:DUF2267 domain-containing protein [Methylomirabilota bacterium]